jgi:phospholipase/lecithinase/hemolysin
MHSSVLATKSGFSKSGPLAALAASLLLFAATAAGDGIEIDELVVFGDSLSDTGNVFAATGGFLPASPPWLEGRFTNGSVWHEILSEGLGLPAAGPSLLGGSNYAWGGAETGPGFAQFGGVPNIGTQIEAYLALHTPGEDQLFVIQGGNNDLIPPGLPEDPEVMVGNVIDHVSRLAAVGARHFLVPTTVITETVPGLNPPLSDYLFPPDIIPPEALPAVIADILERNRRFSRLLRQDMHKLEKALNDQYGEVTISFVNLVITTRLMSNAPFLFGLTDVSSPAVTSFFDPTCFCEGVAAENADEYFYFDIVHPTATVHEVIGELALKTLTWKLALAERRGDVAD